MLDVVLVVSRSVSADELVEDGDPWLLFGLHAEIKILVQSDAVNSCQIRVIRGTVLY